MQLISALAQAFAGGQLHVQDLRRFLEELAFFVEGSRINVDKVGPLKLIESGRGSPRTLAVDPISTYWAEYTEPDPNSLGDFTPGSPDFGSRPLIERLAPLGNEYIWGIAAPGSISNNYPLILWNTGGFDPAENGTLSSAKQTIFLSGENTLAVPIDRLLLPDCLSLDAPGDLANGSATVNNLGIPPLSLAGIGFHLAPGWLVIGAGIPIGTTVLSVTNSTTIVLSANATVNAIQTPLVFLRPQYYATGTISNGSPTVTGVSTTAVTDLNNLLLTTGSLPDLFPSVYGPGIADGTILLSASGTSLTLNQNVTASGTVTLVFFFSVFPIPPSHFALLLYDFTINRWRVQQEMIAWNEDTPPAITTDGTGPKVILNPTTATIQRISSTLKTYVSGMTPNCQGEIKILINVGSEDIVLVNKTSGSTIGVGNCDFVFTGVIAPIGGFVPVIGWQGNYTLTPGKCVLCAYIGDPNSSGPDNYGFWQVINWQNVWLSSATNTTIALNYGNNNDVALPPNDIVFLEGGHGSSSITNETTLTGFAGGYQGRVLVLFNSSSTAIMIANDAGSATGNRIFIKGETSGKTYFPPSCRMVLVWDAAASPGVSGWTDIADDFSTDWIQETPSGSINGTNTNFQLSERPVDTDSILLFIQDATDNGGSGANKWAPYQAGITLIQNNSGSGNSSITLGSAPATGANLLAYYPYLD